MIRRELPTNQRESCILLGQILPIQAQQLVPIRMVMRSHNPHQQVNSMHPKLMSPKLMRPKPRGQKICSRSRTLHSLKQVAVLNKLLGTPLTTMKMITKPLLILMYGDAVLPQPHLKHQGQIVNSDQGALLGTVDLLKGQEALGDGLLMVKQRSVTIYRTRAC